MYSLTLLLDPMIVFFLVRNCIPHHMFQRNLAQVFLRLHTFSGKLLPKNKGLLYKFVL